MVCSQCSEGFLNRPFGVSTVTEKKYDKLFCDEDCLNHFFVNNDKTINCSACGALGRYYSMVRNPSILDEEAWCSLACLFGSFDDVSVVDEDEMMEPANQVTGM